MGLFRFILALCVVASHTPKVDSILSIELGGIAVAVFLFISGYLMPLAFNQNYKFSSFKLRIRNYAVNRFLRIYPIYWIALVLSIAMEFVHLIAGDSSLARFFDVKTLLQNFLLLGLNQSSLWGSYLRFDNPAWSLDVELQYYVCVPFLFVFWKKQKRVTSIGLILLALFSLYLLVHPLGLVDIDRSLIAWASLFILGFFFYQYSMQYKLTHAYQCALIVVFVHGLLLSMCWFLSLNITLCIMISLLTIAAFLLLLQRERYFGSIDGKIGDLSYPVYIFHVMTSSVVSEMLNFVCPNVMMLTDFQQFFIYLICNVLMVTVFSYMVVRVMDKPIERVRSRFKSSRQDVDLTPSSMVSLKPAFY